MSEDSSRSTLPGQDVNPGDASAEVSQDGGACEEEEEVSNNVGGAPDPQQVERVLKEVGSTSTAFIGPALPPGLGAATTDVEESLSAFYKELEEIDSQNAASEALDSSAEHRRTGTDLPDSIRRSRSNLKTSEEELPQRSHWSHNAPYPRRKRSARNSWRRPPPLNGTVKPAFQPELYDCHWGPPDTNHYAPYRPPPWFPPPHSHTSQGFYNDPPHHFHTPFYHDSYGPRDYYDFESENDIWERRHHSPPPCSRVLILMRGLPGSGKSTLARELCTGPSGLILSTDDYFDNTDGYRYDAGLLGAAHKWNQDRAEEAMREGRTPIIIDNTNTQAWEMKPYVHMALDYSYRVDFCEPDTSWKFDPCELEQCVFISVASACIENPLSSTLPSAFRRNTHGVDRGKIAQMMERFCSPVSVSIVLNSQEPQHVKRRREPEQPGTSADHHC
ncbi:NEDD4-binding protein 2-like 2 isoform X1 [Synchiropus splendidus]|uniref:NEDD4-binding protein 2-like 2 isoform X1 n=1 Tax=Synchiropus splendidus TaxID=270530 RepID=UPI00237DD594|nr:NEDD4-binding protein 2-like 2 isoform X1 [Synchiropus splendidus]XP_053728725.1 NEDD4-binding protein 2-like 2 isoform X1 [Synchiropus splendidus]